MKIKYLILLLLTILCNSCYYSHTNKEDHWRPSDFHSVDSVNFRIARHYWKGFNFLVTDSVTLQTQSPAEEGYIYDNIIQKLIIYPYEPWVVVDIAIMPQHPKDSLWVKVANSQWKQGWIPERKLYEYMIADDPVSRFIFFFSHSHILIFGIILGIGILALTFTLWRQSNTLNTKSGMLSTKLLKKRASSIGLMAPGGWKGAFLSVYPTLICLTTSIAAALYGTIQTFAADTWVEYFFHPTLNPFLPDLPLIISLFITSFWLLLIVTLATIFDLLHREKLIDAVLHLAGLSALCILIYLLLTVFIPLYIGYVFLLSYWLFAIKRYLSNRQPKYLCGACGSPIDRVGKCKVCGALNVYRHP